MEKPRSTFPVGIAPPNSQVATETIALELLSAYKSLAFEIEEKGKRAAELVVANAEMLLQKMERDQMATDLGNAYQRLLFEFQEKEKGAVALKLANEALQLQNEEKERQTAALQVANHELEQFAFVASHDLQEPLRTVANYMQVFKEDYLSQLDERATSYLDSVDGAIKRMSLLIKSLLAFSQLGRNKILSVVNCNTMLEEVLEDLKGKINSTQTTFNIGTLPVAAMYQVEMRQVFQNIIVNAMKFAQTDLAPVIDISAAVVPGGWQFCIRDNGIGIEENNFKKIFAIFQRLETKEEREGNGIGLAICQKIIQLHGGEIWVESIPSKETSFYFTIPNQTI